MELLETEEDVVGRLINEPSKRRNYIHAAEFFDQLGDRETANALHNGVMPESLVTKYDLDPYPGIDSAESLDCRRIFASVPQSEKLIAPRNGDTARNTIFNRSEKKCPPEFADLLSGGSMVFNGIDKLYVDRDNNRIRNYSDVNAYLSHRLAGEVDSSARRLNGLTVPLLAKNSKNFYHWHFDVLPVFGMLESCGIAPDTIDNVVVPANPSRFQLEMLEGLGVNSDNVLALDPGYQHVVCDQLVLARIQNSMGLRQPRKNIDWLRSKFLNKITLSEYPDRRVAIMRKERGFRNQQVVESKLLDENYEILYPEEMTYLEQVEAFANASHIISPHGAALTLLAYCRPGTVVHEIYGEHVHPCFWSLSSTLGLVYYNYNCSQITSEEITNAGRGLAERLKKTIEVPDSVIEQILA
jgi:capsular polysaccharide biosynthesis protein